MHGTLSQEYSVDYSHLCLLPHVSAAQLLSVVVELLSASDIPALAVDAGGKKVRDQAYRPLKAAGFKNAGAIVKAGAGASLAGLTDIIGTLPGGRALYLEVKAPAWITPGSKKQWKIVRDAGAPSIAQLAFLDTMGEAGALVGVAWSVGDVAVLIEGSR